MNKAARKLLLLGVCIGFVLTLASFLVPSENNDYANCFVLKKGTPGLVLLKHGFPFPFYQDGLPGDLLGCGGPDVEGYDPGLPSSSKIYIDAFIADFAIWGALSIGAIYTLRSMRKKK